MALDQASQMFLEALAKPGAPAIHESTPAVARMSGPILAGMSGRGPEVGAVESFKLATTDGGEIRMRVMKPEGVPKSVIVYFHGGGWVIGDIDLQYDNLARQLCVKTQSTVVLVNYRKAPEYPFPSAIEDSFAGLKWAAENKKSIAGEVVPLIVAGDSAGGNIAAVMTLRARDQGGPRIDYQVLVYPVTDCDFDRQSYVAPENQLLLNRDTMIWFWNHYLPDGDRTHPDASPLRARNLTGLPPALIYLAEHDPLHDEGAEYATALKNAGVEVEISVAEGQMHGFFQMANILPGFDAGVAYVSERINAHIDNLAKG